MSNPSHAGRRYLVTGAASGIGRATALRLADDGAAVAGLDLEPADLGGRIRGFAADVTDLAAVERAIADAVAVLGGLDGIASVAGIGDFSGDITETPLADWRRVRAVNLDGTFHVARSAIPHLRERGGSIVNVSSQYGLVGCLASPAYVASKAAVIGLTKAMAIDHAPERIRVNVVCPGPTATAMIARTDDTPELTRRERERTAHRNLVDRLMRPEEVAAAIAFLLSDDAASTTGSVVTVDGGWTAG